MTPPVELPPRGERKPKRIRVKVCTGHSGKRPLYNRCTYHVFGKRPKRGDKVRIKAGVYEGRVVEVSRRWSLYRGATYLAERSFPKAWT